MKIKHFFAVILFTFSTFSFASVYKSGVQASYYADKFHGRKTASGETFNMNALTCAHKTLPFGTMLRVTNLKNNKSVDVRVNDRGPFVKGRELDLSKAAAQRLDMIKTGTANVRIEILSASSNSTDAKTASGNTATTVKTAANQGTSQSQYWDVQIGSFSSHENANRLAQSLLQKGFENVYFQKTYSATRVVLKKIPDSKLQATEKKLKSNGYSDFVVTKTI